MLSGKLNVQKVRLATKPGRYNDGLGLYLVVNKGGSKQFILRTAVHGRRCDIGLGGVSYTTLAEARLEASRLRTIARKGGDPLAERRQVTMTFEQAARRVFENNKSTWANPKHAKQWITTLETYAFPHFGRTDIEQVRSAHVLSALSPIWIEKPETARRVRQRIRTVFDWAKGAGHYPHENPVSGLEKALPRQNVAVKHHAALPWRELPEFYAELSQRDGVSAHCLRFIILTGVRSGEGRGACWSEINGDTWLIPASRMKLKKAHRVPLSNAALEVLDGMKPLRDDDLIFPSTTRGKPLSVMVFKSLFKRMGQPSITTHGFRSTFRDWCSEVAQVPREVAEAALAHKTGDATEQAYARPDLFDRRVGLMDAWAKYVTGAGKSGATILQIR
jgi:integrase